jgi:hypothetical protein
MRQARLAMGLLLALLGTQAAGAAEASYPFVGSWVRSDRTCSASAARERVYTARDVVSNRSRCTIRRIASGSGGYQLFERCERPNDKPYTISEIIRMTGPDSMVLTRQTARLKLSRSLHFTRCSTPPASPTKQPAH